MKAQDRAGGLEVLKRLLCGSELGALVRNGDLWTFDFSSAKLYLRRPWRLIVDGEMAFGDKDYDLPSDNPCRINVAEEVVRLLKESKVIDITLQLESADIGVVFGGNSRIECFNNLAGLEAWDVVDSKPHSAAEVVALPGGDIAVWS